MANRGKPSVFLKPACIANASINRINPPLKKEEMALTTPLVARNVFGEPLVPCSFDPLTGYFRDGCCKTNASDVGTHVVCAVMTAEFLSFSMRCGNDLTTARPAWHFLGLKPGDQWCLCANRWKEAFTAGAAPLVVLESTHERALEFIGLDALKQCARPHGEEETS